MTNVINLSYRYSGIVSACYIHIRIQWVYKAPEPAQRDWHQAYYIYEAYKLDGTLQAAMSWGWARTSESGRQGNDCFGVSLII